MPPDGQKDSCYVRMGSSVRPVDQDTSAKPQSSIEVVQYHAADLQRSPIDVPWEKKWTPLPPLDQIPPEERREWMVTKNEDILELIDRAAEGAPEKVAITWLGEKGKVEATYTFDQVARKSHGIAQKLLQKWGLRSGDHVILVYPPGPEFFIAFLACMRAGVVAVPVYPPSPLNLKGDMFKLDHIATNSGSKVALTTGLYKNVVRISKLRGVKWPVKDWYTTDKVEAIKGKPIAYPPRPKGHLAFLQYTSGSTSDPKGVMITHANIAHNSDNIRKNIRLDAQSVFLSWLPQYHDLGLIVAYISTMTAGASGIFMSPITFIKDPPLWVVGMSQFRATHTACPNFALELAVRKFRPEEHAKNGLDLSRLEAMLNCAEPVRIDSIEKWNATFVPYCFHPAAMCPSYGLAEHTVGLLSWGIKMVPAASGDGLLHSSGHWKCQGEEEGDAVFVDPDTLELREPGQVGEIWVRSASVAAGYWQRPEHTQEAFRAKVANKSEWAHYDWLRTGDLGFRLEDQLFICGRLKDLIIVRGKNYYPQDLELAATLALEEVIRPGCVAAFSLSDGPGKFQDQVGLVAEVKSSKLPMLPQRAIALIRQAVSEKYGLELAQFALVQPRTICKTTSGKIQRSKNRAALLAGTLQIISGGLFVDDGTLPRQGGREGAEGVRGEEGGEKDETDPFKILARFGVKELDRDVLSQGLDSLRCMELLAYLKRHANIEIEPTLLATVPARQLVDGTYQSTPLRVQRPSLEAPLQGRPLPYLVVCIIQTAFILLMGLLLGAAIIPTYHFVDHVLDTLKTPFSYMTITSGNKVHRHSFRIYGLLLPFAVPLWMAAFTIEVLIVKWIVIGRYRPGCHALNSWYFLRWWFMDRVLYIWEEVVGVYCVNTIVLNLFYIFGGAHIAWSAKLGAYLHEWALHHVGPHAEADGRLVARLISPGRLYLNKVIVGRGAVVSDHTVVQPGAVVAPGAKLRPMTVLLEGSATEPDVTYQGNPARAVTLRAPLSRAGSPKRTKCGRSEAEVTGTSGKELTGTTGTELTGTEESEDKNWWVLEAAKIVFGLPLSIFLFTYCQIPIMAVFEMIPRGRNRAGADFRYKALFFFGTLIFASMAVGTFITICLKWVLFGRVRPGPYKDTKWLQWRKWWLDLLTVVCQHNLLDVLESSFFVNFWLSALGARICASTKLLISYTIRPYEADLLIAEPDTFISESFVSCDDGEGHRDHVVFKRGSWTGLGAVIEQGVVVGEGSGVGAVTYVEGPHEALAGENVMLFGNPPIVLQHKKAQEALKRIKIGTLKLVFFHTVVLLQRMGILGILVVCAIPGLEFGMAIHRRGIPLDVELLLYGIGILLSIATLAVTSIVLKWVAHGKFSTGPLKHSLSIGTYTTTDTLDNYMVFRFVFPFINGSYLAVLFHRAMGGRIGKNCFMNPGSFRDHDIIAVGDDVILDECHVQGHKFEHGHIAFDVTAIGSGSTLQPEAICMAGDTLEDGATLASLSKPFPGLPCSADRYWVGSPAVKAKVILSNGEEMEEADSGLGGGYDMDV